MAPESKPRRHQRKLWLPTLQSDTIRANVVSLSAQGVSVHRARVRIDRARAEGELTHEAYHALLEYLLGCTNQKAEALSGATIGELKRDLVHSNGLLTQRDTPPDRQEKPAEHLKID
jgi:hypothetical protein